MNVTQAPTEQATAALAGWLSRSDFFVEVEKDDGRDCVWRVAERGSGERALLMRRFGQINALALSYTLLLAHGPRLKKLEMVSELNDIMAFARFSLNRSEDLQVEYMISCGNDYLPSCLAPVVHQLFEIQEPLQSEIELWGLDPSSSRPRSINAAALLC